MVDAFFIFAKVWGNAWRGVGSIFMGTSDKFTVVSPPIIVGLTACLVYVASVEILSFLMVWMTLSIPIGVLIGHCALSEE